MLDWLATKFPTIAERLLPSDPGSLRLFTAFSATLAGLMPFFEIEALGAFLPFGVPDRVLGFAIALFCAASLRDATRGQRAATIGLAPIARFSAVILAAFAPHRFDIAAWLLPAIMFAATYGAARGPRWASLGVVTLIAFLISVVSHPTFDMLPMGLFALLLAATNVALLRLVILPERPESELARLRRSISRAMARILGAMAIAQRSG